MNHKSAHLGSRLLEPVPIQIALERHIGYKPDQGGSSAVDLKSVKARVRSIRPKPTSPIKNEKESPTQEDLFDFGPTKNHTALLMDII